jgi:hypothetical protein
MNNEIRLGTPPLLVPMSTQQEQHQNIMSNISRRRESRERIWACSDPPAVLTSRKSSSSPTEPNFDTVAPDSLARSTADGGSARSSEDLFLPDEPVNKLPEHMLALAPHGEDANNDDQKGSSVLLARKRQQLGSTKNKIPQVLGAALSENKLQEEKDPLMSALRQALRLELGHLLSNRGKFHEVMREEVRGALTDIRNEAMKMSPRAPERTPPDSPGLLRRSSTKSQGSGDKEGKIKRTPSNKSSGSMSEGDGTLVTEEAKEYLKEIVSSMARHTEEKDLSVQGSKASWAQWLEDVLDTCDKIKEPVRTGQLASISQSKAFEAVVLVVIFVNCGYMAYSADYGVKNPGKAPSSEVFADWYFQIFYTMELVIKLIVHRAYFFVNENWKANWFDAFLVVTGWMGFIQSDDGGGGVSGSFLRIIRLAKLGRTMRAVRAMSELKHLRAFLVCLQGSFMSFFWSLVMLLCVLFIFSLFMLQILDSYLVDNGMQLGDSQWLEIMYGGVLQSILTLFRASTGGDDWAVAYEVIAQTGAFGALIYLVFIAFTQLALINIITGIFVESAMQTLRPDREMLTMEQRRIESEHAAEMERLCRLGDADGSGTISPQEFEKMLARGRLPRLLTLLGLSKHHVVEFFTTMSELSPQTEGEVDIRSFVQACMQLKGAATNFDVQMIHAELRSMWQKSDSRLSDISEKLYALESLIDGYEYSDEIAGSNESEGPALSA